MVVAMAHGEFIWLPTHLGIVEIDDDDAYYCQTHEKEIIAPANIGYCCRAGGYICLSLKSAAPLKTQRHFQRSDKLTMQAVK